jgi:hypothetical protein
MTNRLLMPALFAGTVWAAQMLSAQQIPPGTRIDVRTNDRIETRDASDGRVYAGFVANDVLDSSNRVVIPRGSPTELIVRRVGQDELSLDLESVRVGDRRYSIDTAAMDTDAKRRDGIGENRRTGEFVGGGAVIGTLLGAIAGGGKGAAIGALAGGAAGAGTQMVTRGREVHIPAESVLSFRLEHPMNIFQDRGFDRDGQHYHRMDSDRDRRRDDDRGDERRDDRRSDDPNAHPDFHEQR